jgi:hypothetical protein
MNSGMRFYRRFSKAAEHFFVRAPRAESAAAARGGVCQARAADGAWRSRCSSVVVGMQDEEHIDRALQHGIGCVFRFGHLPEHAEEVAREGQVVVRIYERQPAAVAIGEGGDRRHLGDKAPGLQLARSRIVDVSCVRVVRRERADGADEHAHGMGIVVEAIDELLDVLVDHR